MSLTDQPLVISFLLAYVVACFIELASQNVGAPMRFSAWAALLPPIPPMVIAACVAYTWALPFPHTWVVATAAWRAIIIMLYVATRRS